MCTAISFRTKDAYFGRNLDLEGSFGEGVCIAPRNLAFEFRKEGTLSRHFALIGTAIVRGNTPLWFDAVNEKGLGMAGLNFPKNARYFPPKEGKKNVAPFELISFVLSKCSTVKEARALLSEVNVVSIPFDETLPLTPLHWMIADGEECLVAEPTEAGLLLYDDPAFVLTNNPPFPEQLTRLRDYLSLTVDEPKSRFSERLPLEPYSRGMGAIGLPGDWSSASRFVKAAFLRANIVAGEGEEGGVCAFFHMLEAVAMPRGLVRLKPEVYEETVYSVCCNTRTGRYYYTTYGERSLHAVSLENEDMEGGKPVFYAFAHTLGVREDNARS